MKKSGTPSRPVVRVKPAASIPGNRVKSFVKSNTASTLTSNSSSFFNEEGPNDVVSFQLIQDARKTGILSLVSRNLCSIPVKVWSLNEIQKEEVETRSVSLDSTSDQRWWEFQELQKLVIANNCITDIPSLIQRLTFLQILDAHDNRISIIASEIGFLENLLKLNLNQNKIEVIPRELYNLRLLTDLRLGQNYIKEISPEIGNFSKLTFLELQDNHLKSIPPDIGFLSYLKTLNLSKNKIEQLPPDFSGLTGLSELDLSENLLSDVGSLFSDFRHLKTLHLFQNKLKHIPDFQNTNKLTELHMRNNLIRKFSSNSFTSTVVQLIDLRANKISDLDVALDDLEFLDRIYLDNNEIEKVPTELPFLQSLKQLTLEGNPLKGIRIDILQRGSVELLKYLRSKHVDEPVSQKQSTAAALRTRKPSGSPGYPDEATLGVDIHKLKATGQLNLNAMAVKELPDQVFVIAAEAKTDKFCLSQNLLSSLPSSFEQSCDYLRELNLDQNKFTELPVCISQCTHLYYLTFQNNQVKDLPKEFSNLKKLREINMGFNKFISIPSCLFEIPSLEQIYAPDNKIEKIDVDKLKRLPRLATIILDNNDISYCPPELGYLPLTLLSVQGNLFRIPSFHILKKGTDALMTYLRNRCVPPQQ